MRRSTQHGDTEETGGSAAPAPSTYSPQQHASSSMPYSHEPETEPAARFRTPDIPPPDPPGAPGGSHAHDPPPQSWRPGRPKGGGSCASVGYTHRRPPDTAA